MIDLSRYTIEYCPFCDAEVVIFAEGVTACPHCGAPLAPCSVCDIDCNGPCPYGCDGSENDAHKVVTNPAISPELSEKLYALL